jgi:CHAT domain
MIAQTVKVTITVDHPDLEADEADEAARRLLTQLREMDEVESAGRVLDPSPPEGNKSAGGFQVGTVQTEVKPNHLKSLFGFLGQRAGHQPLEIEIEVGDRKIKVTANNQGDLIAAERFVQQLLVVNAAAGSDRVRKILILAANPKGTVQLRLDQEVRDIAEGLRRSQRRDQFAIEQKWAVRPRDIQRAMLDINPQIIHFSGHGEGEEGLVFEDEVGQSKLVKGEALAGLFKLFADQVECVVLNGCYSDVQAGAIAQHIPYVVGMTQAIGDRAALEFSVGFYEALGAGRDMEFAYEMGCCAIRLAGIGEALTPVLKKKE